MEDGCVCQNCNKKYKVDLLIPNKLWERIKPEGKTEGAGLLCPKCIGERLIGLNEFLAFALKEIL